MDTCDSCIYVVECVGADGPPIIESEHFQSSCSGVPIDDSHDSVCVKSHFSQFISFEVNLISLINHYYFSQLKF